MTQTLQLQKFKGAKKKSSTAESEAPKWKSQFDDFTHFINTI